MTEKEEAILINKEEGKPLYMMSADRYVEDENIFDKDFLWFLYDDFEEMKKRLHRLIQECSSYPDYKELEHIETDSVLLWDSSYTCQYTGVTVRFVFFGEQVA